MSRLGWAVLGLAGTVLLIGTLYAGGPEVSFPAWVGFVIVLAVGSGLLVALAAFLLRSKRLAWWQIAVLILAALAFRVALMQADGELSDDAARYHWDGKALAHGINPYLYAPADSVLSEFRTDRLDERINHPDVRTVYPPLAEILFAVAYRIHPGRLTGFHLLSLIAELLTWLVLARELARRRGSASYLLLAAWSPLAIIEGYLPGHVDLLAMPLVLLFVLEAERRRPLTAGLLLGLACLIKPFPLIFVPAALRELGARRGLVFSLALAGVGIALYLPFLQAGSRLYSSMLLMFREWSFNGSLGALLETFLQMETAHRVSAVLTAGLVLAGAWGGRDLLSRLLLASAAWVAFAPALFPWYLVILLPLIVLRPDPALIALCTLAPVAEEAVGGYRASGFWDPAGWPVVIEYVPFYLLLVLGACKGWGMFRRSRDRCYTSEP